MQPTDHMSTAVEYSCGAKNKQQKREVIVSGSALRLRSTWVCSWLCTDRMIDLCG